MFKASNTFFSVLKRFLRCFPLLIENISFWEGELPWDPTTGTPGFLFARALTRGETTVSLWQPVCVPARSGGAVAASPP